MTPFCQVPRGRAASACSARGAPVGETLGFGDKARPAMQTGAGSGETWLSAEKHPAFFGVSQGWAAPALPAPGTWHKASAFPSGGRGRSDGSPPLSGAPNVVIPGTFLYFSIPSLSRLKLLLSIDFASKCFAGLQTSVGKELSSRKSCSS